MAEKIVAIGACVADTLMRVPHYPREDSKLRATASKMAGGGPAATGLVAAARLGAETAFIGKEDTDEASGVPLDDNNNAHAGAGGSVQTLTPPLRQKIKPPNRVVLFFRFEVEI